MKTPFPGMDPYLEHPARWLGVHNRLITQLADAVAPSVAPHYYVDIESRIYVIRPEKAEFVGRSDVAIVSPLGVLQRDSRWASDVQMVEVELPIAEEIDHLYLEVRQVNTHTLITTIEIVSPVSKSDKRGREAYLEKRDAIFSSRTNLVEIDLLRAGEPLLTAENVPASDYRILISRGWRRPMAQLIAFNLRHPIPDFRLPLQQNEDEPVIALNDIVHQMYTRARYDLQIDYSKMPVPPLNEADWQWAQQFLPQQ